MPIFNLYSKRKKRHEAGEPDVYQYDKLPTNLRQQIVYILKDAIGHYHEYSGNEFHSIEQNNSGWTDLRDALIREHGIGSLSSRQNPQADILGCVQGEANIDLVFDVVELSFRYIDKTLGRLPSYKLTNFRIEQGAKDAIKELNYRLREAGVGYRYEDGQIIRVDSELIHAEVVKPTLALLNDPRFAGPQDEFLNAHAHLRSREYKDCVVDALNAFESTLKAICDIKGWQYEKGARATDLIKVLRAKNFFPDYLDASFEQLLAVLKSGLPKIRNESGGHGQGAQPKETPEHIAAFALHLTAAKIVFLVDTLRADEKAS